MTGDFRPDRRLVDEDGPEDLDHEIRFHIEERVRRLMAEGWEEADARAEALRRFGSVDQVRAGMARQDRIGRWMMGWRGWFDGLRMDLRVGLRQWRSRPGPGLLAVLTLALGIGATTAIFSLVDGILLRPLPYPAPDRLAVIWSDWTERGGPDREWFGWPDLYDLREEVDAFEEVGIWTDPNVTVTGLGDASQHAAMVASVGTLSRVFRVTPELGRLFGPEDDGPDAPNHVVVSYAFWRDRLGADPNAVGRAIEINGASQLVIGVLPEDFRVPIGGTTDPAVWMTPGLAPDPGGRGDASWRAVARMVPGMTIESANQQLDAFANSMRERWPDAYIGKTPVAYDMRDDVVRSAESGLRLVLGAVLVVLLLAAVNVANILLARNTVREGELAVRAAIGAGRGRIVRQLLVETGVLAAVGGAAGLVVGWIGTRGLKALAPAGTPRIDAVSVDPRVLGFALLVTLGAALVAGLLPALRSGRRELRDALVGSGRDSLADRAGLRIRGALVVTQVALAVTLMAMGGVLGRSFSALRSVDFGFDPTDVATFMVSFPGETYADVDSRAAFQAELAERLGALPGVRAAGAVSSIPLGGFDGDVGYTVEGEPPPEPGEGQAVWIRRTVPGYMEAMDLTIVSGRGIEARDVRDATPVMVINETLAERHFANSNPIGRRINLGDPADPLWFEVVGVAKNVRNFAVRDDFRVAAYLSNGQFPGRTLFFTLEAEPGIEPTSLIAGARGVLAEMDPSIAITQPNAMADIVSVALGPDRFLAALLAGFAGLALVLAVVGLYGVVNYSVTARLREMGVRMALGAGGGRIRRLVVARGFVPVGIGLVVGLGLTWFASRLVAAQLYGVSSLDPVSLAGTTVLMIVTALTAAAVPAIRASRVDPIEVLRQE